MMLLLLPPLPALRRPSPHCCKKPSRRGERVGGAGGNEIPCQFGMRHELSLLSEKETTQLRTARAEPSERRDFPTIMSE